jgi:hypothetical protein
VVLLTKETFTRNFPNALINTRGYFEGENRLVVNFVNSDSLFALLSRVLGTERLKSISNLELQVRFLKFYLPRYLFLAKFVGLESHPSFYTIPFAFGLFA